MSKQSAVQPRKSGKAGQSDAPDKPPDGKKGGKNVEVPEARDVIDGIPDRVPGPHKWVYVLIALVFLAWVAVLITMQMAGHVH